MIPQLRDYQARAVTALYEWLSVNVGNPCIVAPTGSGKSWIIAALCEDILRQWPQSRIVVLSHVKELLEQDAEKIKLAWSDAPMGLYSAGLNRREIDVITVAGIQSIWKKGPTLGRVDLIIVDECHLINHKDAGMYRTLIDGLKVTNPDLRIVGLTATPYRMNHGLITQGNALFDDLIEPVTIEELVTRGFLAPLRSKLPELVLDVDGVAKRGGEYVERDLQQAVDRSENNEAIVREVLARAGDRKAWLFFCTGVEHARHMRDILRSHGVTSEAVVGDTPPAEREQILRDFKSGRVKALTNANVLTTGFDHPDIDLLAMCRPTLSPGLYVQMAGRGMRLKSHADHCLVLDFAGNVATHGPITAVVPPRKSRQSDKKLTRECPECAEICAIKDRVCPACGYLFPKQERESKEMALRHKDDIMGLEPSESDITGWRWSVVNSRSTDIAMIRVDYLEELGLFSSSKLSDYLCLLHSGFAAQKAYRLLVSLAKDSGVSLTMPSQDEMDEEVLQQIVDAMDKAPAPNKVTWRRDGKYYRVIERFWPEREADEWQNYQQVGMS